MTTKCPNCVDGEMVSSPMGKSKAEQLRCSTCGFGGLRPKQGRKSDAPAQQETKPEPAKKRGGVGFFFGDD